jgi:uncharacterized membrane protein
MREVGKIVLQGLAAVLPLALTGYVLWWLGSTAERVFEPLLTSLLPETLTFPGSVWSSGWASCSPSG